MALTKADLAEALFNELGLNKREAKEFVEFFFEKIREALENGESVKLSGFGNFGLRKKNPRPGRNPKTGDSVELKGKNVPHFKPGKDLRERVNMRLQLEL